MDRATHRRNVLVLAVCQALAMTGASIMMTVSALAGDMLATNKALATLPLGLQFTATMLTTVPASMLMKRVGRRHGFSLGAVFGICGGAVCYAAVASASFPLFCLGNSFIGIAMGFALFYRFAAADEAEESFRAKAISLVLAGGVVAAICGPELAKWSRTLLAPLTFAGSFLVIGVLAGTALLILQLLRIPRLSAAQRQAGGRPLGTIVRQPTFMVAALGGMIGYGVMSLVMTATPLAMVAHHHPFNDAAFVIQWHALGMFAPSFVTGHLINRFGVLNIMLTGTFLLASCVIVNLSGVALSQFWLALVLLGVGWNFLYIGASTLLTQTYAPAEKAKVQALNDFLIFGAVALSSFSSGALHSQLGWHAVNYGVIAPVLLVFLAILWMRLQRASMPA